MTPEEEKYLHHVSSINNLNNAWRVLLVIKKQEGNNLIASAF
jgi:hypothetical protein